MPEASLGLRRQPKLPRIIHGMLALSLDSCPSQFELNDLNDKRLLQVYDSGTVGHE